MSPQSPLHLGLPIFHSELVGGCEMVPNMEFISFPQ